MLVLRTRRSVGGEHAGDGTTRTVDSVIRSGGFPATLGRLQLGTPPPRWLRGHRRNDREVEGIGRHELLDGELFLHIDETKYVVERGRMDYNHYRPYSSLGYMTPTGFAELCRRAPLEMPPRPRAAPPGREFLTGRAGCIRPHTPALDGVHDCGILS